MNNLIDMSDYEKIIFVNGIDENQGTNIRDLSKNYPFVVFFTNNEEAKNSLGYPVANIWKGIQFNDELIATRLTRFVGVDPNANTLKINGKTIKIRFNYDTGLIGFYDETVDNLFVYAGYTNPLSSEFNVDSSYWIAPFTRDTAGLVELWNWHEKYVMDVPFYIAIPYEYKDTIKPRWEGYIYINNQKVYQPCVEWFSVISDTLEINDTRFIVYKSKSNGIFHGKIQ